MAKTEVLEAPSETLDLSTLIPEDYEEWITQSDYRLKLVAACFPQSHFYSRALETAIVNQWVDLTFDDIGIDSKILMGNYDAICSRYSTFLRQSNYESVD